MAKNLKIGLVLDTSLDPPDGVQQYVVSVGEWLRDQGHDVHYLVGETKERQLPNIHSLSRNISVQFNGNRTTIPLPTSRRKLRRLLDTEKFDVLHVQTPHSPFMAQRLVLAAGPKTAVIGTFHIVPYSWLGRIGNRLLGVWLRPSLRRFDRIISVSDAAAAFAYQSFGIETDVVPNTFDYNRFHSAKPLAEYRGKPITVLFLNRLVPRKGCRVLLEAAARLVNNPGVPDFRVVVCGKGPEAPSLHRFIKKHGLADVVEMVGFVSEADKPRYFASADIAAFPSSAGESFGIVLLEAMATGRTAVLAGDNPGYRSVMEPRPELLFQPTDVDDLAALLTQYIRSARLRQAAGSWGEEYTRDFDVSVVCAKLLDIYTEALHKRRQT